MLALIDYLILRFGEDKNLIFIYILLLVNLIFSIKEDAPANNPLQNLIYPNAFDHQKIDLKYRKLLEHLGCAENVFSSAGEQSQESQCLSLTTDSLRNCIVSIPSRALGYENHDDDFQSMLKSYNRECLKKLKQERRVQLLRPVREAFLLLFFLTSAMTTLPMLIGPSGDNSFGMAILSYELIYILRDIVKSVDSLIYTPTHLIDSLEREFATNQCYIPKTLWPKIIEEFMKARQNPFEQGKSKRFLDFVMGLTIYKPIPKFPTVSSTKVYEKIFANMDQFFKDYEPKEYKDIEWDLKNSITGFIEALVDKNNTNSKYLYIMGDQGRGKTHFIRQLSEWINGEIPNTVHFEDVKIVSHEQLEGNDEMPGILLRVLQNQCKSKKHGSLVFIDEADLNNELNSAAKRTFNGQSTKINTEYLGKTSDGQALQIDIPPMFVVLASNQDIEDVALADRFTKIVFPTPLLNSLIKHSIAMAKKNQKLSMVKDKDSLFTALKDKITAEKPESFRLVNKLTERLVLKHACNKHD